MMGRANGRRLLTQRLKSKICTSDSPPHPLPTYPRPPSPTSSERCPCGCGKRRARATCGRSGRAKARKGRSRHALGQAYQWEGSPLPIRRFRQAASCCSEVQCRSKCVQCRRACTAAVVRMWHRARVEKGDSAGGEARKHHGWRAGAMQGQTCCGKGAGARMMSQQ